MSIQSLSLRNYGVFRNAEFLGLSPLTIVVGANGTGKSTLLDVFFFLKDALARNVHEAAMKRGGFRELVSRGVEGSIEIILGYSAQDGRLLVYALRMSELDGRVVVETEQLRPQAECAVPFMDFRRGQGTAVSGPCGQKDEPDAKQLSPHQLNDASTLAVSALGQFKAYPLIAELRSLIERWHLSNLREADVRLANPTGHAEHLSPTGDNAARVVEYFRQRHPERFREVLEAMRQRVPGVNAVEAKTTEDNRLLLCFEDRCLANGFPATRVSAGTIKVLAYLLLLHDPHPHPLLGVEEPENHLYPDVLGHITEELQCYARRGGQVLMTTHSPELVDAARLDEIFWLEKKDGFSQARRAIDSPVLKGLVGEGELPGELWMQRLFEGAHPQ